MEEAKALLKEARDKVEEAIEILKEECPTETIIAEELQENKIQI